MGPLFSPPAPHTISEGKAMAVAVMHESNNKTREKSEEENTEVEDEENRPWQSYFMQSCDNNGFQYVCVFAFSPSFPYSQFNTYISKHAHTHTHTQ